MSSPSLNASIRIVLAELERDAELSDQSTTRLGRTIEKFGGYLARGYGIVALAQVTSDHAGGFLQATAGNDLRDIPSIATQHFRRSAIRLLFRVARRLGLADSDPTLDLALPPRSCLRRRPLTHDEIALCRSAALRTLTETRQPAAWALAEASARTSEIPHIRARNLDLEAGRVWILGSSRTVPRWGHLTPWGQKQLGRRLSALGSHDDPLVYSGRASSESGQASSCAAIATILCRAGLHSEPDVRPASVAGWAGAEAFSAGAQIDEVARLLGVRSLDRAARIIGWDWTDEPERPRG